MMQTFLPSKCVLAGGSAAVAEDTGPHGGARTYYESLNMDTAATGSRTLCSIWSGSPWDAGNCIG